MIALLLAAGLAAAPGPEEAVRAADLEMARAVDARDARAFERCVDPDAIFSGERGLLRGRPEIGAVWGRYFEPSGPRLAWAPERAVVAASGDLAFTTGSFTWEGEVRPGERKRSTGAYVTVWRRAGDGTWRALFDAPLAPAERLGPGLVREAARKVASAAGDLVATAGTWARGEERGIYVTIERRGDAAPAVDSAVAVRPAPR